MDQTKIGRFIAEKRKEQGLTQMQLAEALGITDRAVSKWETGRSLPDASIMTELCGILNITVNDLLNGEMVSMERYSETAENNLLEMVRHKEAADRRLLRTEVVICIVSIGLLLALIAIGAMLGNSEETRWIFFLMLAIGIAQVIVCSLFAVRIEQTAGYYECGRCGYRYVPGYGSVNLAPHMGRTRWMKCPKCGEKSWQKKVLTKD